MIQNLLSPGTSSLQESKRKAGKLSCAILCLFVFSCFTNTVFAQDLKPEAIRQINVLLAEKASRTPAQKKIDSRLLLLYKLQTDKSLKASLPDLNFDDIKVDDGKIKVNVTSDVNSDLLTALKGLNCNIDFSSEKFKRIVAHLPLKALERIAALPSVKRINLWQAPVHSDGIRADKKVDTTQYPSKKAGFSERASNVSKQFQSFSSDLSSNASASTGSTVSEADVTHKVNLARAAFGVRGKGVKVGVLSDGVDGYAASQASGDLPAVIHILPGQEGVGLGSEGRAMMELIHDLAPEAELYFATADNGQPSFAQNIINLRAAGCDIIVDDVSYYAEGVFQNDVIARAVDAVTASGALYFSSAANSGNKDDGTAGAWEGDFTDGGAQTLFKGGTVHNFGGGNLYDVLTVGTYTVTLKWSDPLGASGNDYDLFITNSTGTSVIGSSTTVQDGNDNPYESVYKQAGFPANSRIYIVKDSGEAVRALHLNTNRGQLSISTPGVMYGHNAAASAYSVAATPAADSFYKGYPQGPFPNTFTSANKTELFTSDGPRRMFFNPDGSEITPGNVLFGTNGGIVLQKPDITAADGTVTSTPGFERFYGTSAAAPHAAAIAALIKSKFPAATPAQIKAVLIGTAIDIEAPGWDRDAGAGIIMAYEALKKYADDYGPVCPAVTITNVSTVQPSCPTLTGSLTITATSNSALEYSIDDSIYQSSNVFNNLAPSAYAVFARPVGNASCVVGYTPLVVLKQVVPATTNVTTTSYTGAAVNIPDGVAAGVNIPLAVSGLGKVLTDINFRLDGSTDSNCTTATASVAHTYISDLTFTLKSPSGKSAILISQIGGSNDNFCTVTLDDDSSYLPIQKVTTGSVSGKFAPASPLSVFDGEDPNGTWILNVSDAYTQDAGILRKFSLIISSAPYLCPPDTTPVAKVTAVLPFTSCQNQVSGIQSFTISAKNLTKELVIAAPSLFEISNDSTRNFADTVYLYPNNGTVASTPVYVRMRASAQPGDTTQLMRLTSGGTLLQTLSLTGKVQAAHTWYRDADGDGFGNLATTTQDCSQPAGYVADSTDCNDNDSTIQHPVLYYIDSDLDGYGSNDTILLCTNHPATLGYVRNHDDCNDRDFRINPTTQWVMDKDSDGYYAGDSAVVQCTSPGTGYIVKAYAKGGGDCNDNDAAINPNTAWVLDADKDGYYTGDSVVQCASPGSGYVVKSNQVAGDCNDNDATVHQPQTYYVDADRDGYGSSTTALLCSSTAPLGYSTNNMDCNDADKAINPRTVWVLDADKDGYYTGDTLVQCSIPGTGYVIKTSQIAGDCNDNDSGIHAPLPYYADNDKDGYGAGSVVQICSSTAPAGYSVNNTDCNDNSAAINPKTLWVLDADKDGYYTGNPVMQCTVPGSGYVVKTNQTPGDCNDNNATINPATQWVLDADKDNYYTGNPVTRCTSPGYGYVIKTSLLIAGDCNDNNASINPKTVWVLDADKDGYYTGTPVTQCLQPGSGYVVKSTQQPGDCNDYSAKVHPNQTDGYDGIDNDCDGQVDEDYFLLSVNDAKAFEGNSGRNYMYFFVSLNHIPSRTITVNYTTQNGTATAGSDYVAVSGTLTFPAGIAMQLIAVPVIGDREKEADETFKVVLSNAYNATLNKGTATGTILNDDFKTTWGNSLIAGGIKAGELKAADELSVKLSPVPARSNLTLSLSGFEGKTLIQLFSSDGKQVKQQNWLMPSQGALQQVMDVSDLAGGTYLLVISDEKGNRKTEKFVVSR